MKRTFNNVITLLEEMERVAQSVADYERRKADREEREPSTFYYQEMERALTLSQIAEMLKRPDYLSDVADVYFDNTAGH